MSDRIPWIREEMIEVYPALDINGGIDLDQNGHSVANEIADVDGDSFVSESEAGVFYLINKDVFNDRIPYFQWGTAFRRDNPIHELIHLESKLRPADKIERTYSFLTDILTRTRESLSSFNDSEEVSPFTKMAHVYLALKDSGAVFLPRMNSSLFVDDIIRNEFDCDTSTFILLAIAFEMGWPVYAAAAPHHLFAIWDDGENERLNFEIQYGDAYTTESYINRFNIEQTSIDQGVFLRKLSSDELEGLFFTSVAIAEYLDGNYEAALNEFNISAELYPLDVTTINNRGATYGRLGRYDSALNDLQRALHMNPNDPNVYNNLGYLKVRMGRYDEAIADLNRGIELAPNDALIYENRAIAEANLERFEDAIADLDKAIGIDPSRASFYAWRARAEASIGRYQEAVNDFDRSLELDPGDVTVREDLERVRRHLSEQ